MTEKNTFGISEICKSGGISALKSSAVVDSLLTDIRTPALILTDTSGSMQSLAASMQEAFVRLYDRLLQSPRTRSCTELGVISFNEIVEVLSPLSEVSRVSNDGRGLRIKCRLQTLTGLALVSALDHLDKRLTIYRDNDLRYYPPILFFISDGVPYVSRRESADEDSKMLSAALEKIRFLVENNLLTVIAYELGNDCDHELMTRITGLPDDRHVRKFPRTAQDVDNLFTLTSEIITSSSNRLRTNLNALSIDEILAI